MDVVAANVTGYVGQTVSAAAPPEWLNNADNAWQMVAATLVAMMSIPGLAAMYAGMVLNNHWRTNAALMVFYGFGATLLCWVLIAYNLAFGEWWAFFVGQPGVALKHNYLLNRAGLPASTAVEKMANFPMASLVYFQFAFAAVAVVLVAGSLLGRMKIHAWMLFAPLWLIFSYTVGAFSMWGGGFLYRWGIIDFAGGFVVHLAAGTAGFTAAAWIAARGSMRDAPGVAGGGGYWLANLWVELASGRLRS
ncbi:hypothetical protein L7F22_058719 [Adiantum nelumboides]|nr:hypothetical protein [Adiantum nelumboides]